MSGSLTPMAGMGTTGATLGSASMLTPQMIQMLLQRAQMAGGNGASPMMPGGAVTPMSARMPFGMAPPMAPPPTAQMPMPAQPGQVPQGAMGSLMNNPQMLQQLLAALKGQQLGVNPLAASQNPLAGLAGSMGAPAGGLT